MNLSRISSVGACLVLCSGCVLAESADSYPFRPALSVSGTNSTPNNTTPNNTTPLPPPSLIFTEILIDAPGSDPFVTERGEYIEIKNIGEGPADPRGITMILSDLDELVPPGRIEVGIPFSPEEVAAVAALEPIEPGGYFVFARYEVTDSAPLSDVVSPGAIYDYGRFASGPTLPHQEMQRRRLDLGYRYPNGETETFDTLRYEGRALVAPEGTGPGLAFDVGLALALDASAEDAAANDDPANWCVPDEMVGSVHGTPGAPTACP